eukprot:gene36382-biopygen3850
MAPELISESEIYTRKSDVYSLGMTLWELVSRKIPFQNASNSELICTWVKDGQREDVPEHCPPTLAHVIKTCWSGDPDHRPHAEAVLGQLKSLVDTDLPVVRSGRNSGDATVTGISLPSTGTAPGIPVTAPTRFPFRKPLEQWTDAELKTRLEAIRIEMNRGARAGPPSLTKSLGQWSCEEVVDWLISVQLSSLIPVVRERAIGGEMLGCCETEEAVAELGFDIDQARLLFKKVQECKASARMPLSPLFATIASGSASSVDSLLEPVAQALPEEKVLPSRWLWWRGSRIPTLRKPLTCPWLKADLTGREGDIVLQAAYLDRYGDVCPSRADVDKSRFSTYRHGKGKYLHAPWISEKQKRLVSEANVRKLAERLKSNESLTIFLSSPFNGAQDERIAFMNTVLPSLNKLCGSRSIHVSVVDMRWGITDEMSGKHETVRTCLSAIDKSDIFLGYFGARYGSSNYSTVKRPDGRTWIDDDVEYAASFPQFSYIKDYGDRSITEMEFLHAITYDKNYEKPDKPVSFVFYRDPKYDEQMYNNSKVVEDKVYGDEGRGKAVTSGLDPSFWYITEKDSAGPLQRLKDETKSIASLSGKYISVFDRYANPQLGADLMHICCETLIQEALKL